MRSRNSLMRERQEAFRDARLIVIASEGKDTERIYFKALAKEYTNPRVHVHILVKTIPEFTYCFISDTCVLNGRKVITWIL